MRVKETSMDVPETTAALPVITLSESAVKEVKRLINVQGLTEGGLRLGVKGGGCSGLSYTINFDEKIGQYDAVYDIEGVKVIVDAKSAIYLQGTQLDFQKDLMGGQFKFVNPNANKTCGCGESFSA
jgi:iron-sulfur cluster assembly protein